MLLNESNYFSPEAERAYMGSTQFKNFMACEAAALARIQGKYKELPSTAMLVGSYVDAHFSGTLGLFRAQHPEIMLKSGELKAEFRQADQIINRIEADPLMLTYLSGKSQVILTGLIAGVQFKIKIDSYSPGNWVVDQKIMRDMDRKWQDGAYRNFVEAWGYDYQAAIYSTVEGNRLPFILAVATKEEQPNIELLSIPQEVIDERLAEIEELVPRFQAIKLGLEDPSRCGKCDYCKATKVLTRVIDYREVGE
jgi:uncharacterized protein with FMN-binding domain